MITVCNVNSTRAVKMATSPKIWTRFSKTSNGKEIKFRIQELPISRLEEIMDLVFNYFVPEESFHKAAKISQNEKAFNEYKVGSIRLAKEMNYLLDVCCLDDDSEDLKIVAGSLMVLEKKDDPPLDWEPLKAMVQTKEMKTFFDIMGIVSAACNVVEKYNLDSYYDDKGIVVHPAFRRLGIAEELLKARALICKERGVPMTGAWMTAFGTQRAAAKLGWETIRELTPKDFDEISGVSFEGGPPSLKLMVIKV